MLLKNKTFFKLFTFTIAVIIIAATVYCGYYILVGSVSTSGSTHPPFGSLQIEVASGTTFAPIEGAAVVIAETGESYKTGTDGKTPLIRVPIIENTTFSHILAMPWGEVTLIVYKDGYTPYVLFHTQVWENEARQGPRIFMFEDDGSSQPFSIVEGPQRIWVNQLVEKFFQYK